MNFDDQEQDCTIYIEELKSDDPNLKINAIQKLETICKILGPSRTREELIPYLIEIIEECDNEEEFLIKMADQFLKIKDLLGGQKHSQDLILPLELLSSFEEIEVRKKAVAVIIKLSEDQNQEYFQKILLLIKQLSEWDNYPSRVSACSLIASCYTQVNQNEQTELRQLFSQLAHDDSPMVRRGAAENLQHMCNILDKPLILSEIIPLWGILVRDTIDSVKIKAVESTIVLAKKLTKIEIADNFIGYLKNIDPYQKSWRVRYALAEILPVLVKYLDKDQIKKDILDTFEGLLKDSEQEVKSIALIKTPEICEQIASNLIKDQIIPQIQNLAIDPSQHVRNSVAQIICKISNQFDTLTVQNLIFPIIEKIYKDEAVDVKQSILHSLGTQYVQNLK